MPPLYLASASPRRAALLTQLGIPFQVIPPTTEEGKISDGPPRAVERAVMSNALKKANGAAATLVEGLVIAGDTVVLTNRGRSLGKPNMAEHALKMLRQLVGTWHSVLSAVAVVDAATSKSEVRLASARVWFRQVPDADLRRYVATGEPLDKAGAYAIQGLGGFLVNRVTGSYTAVVGFPLELVVSLLAKFGITVPDYWVKADASLRSKTASDKQPSKSKRA